MDKKGARITCLTREEVVVLIRIKEMYVRVLQNHLSMIVVECISTDRKAIPSLVIVLSVMIIEWWFHKKMIGHKLVTVSSSGYTNEGICMAWLHYFIKYNDYSLDKE
jgi:hypothetical protein